MHSLATLIWDPVKCQKHTNHQRTVEPTKKVTKKKICTKIAYVFCIHHTHFRFPSQRPRNKISTRMRSALNNFQWTLHKLLKRPNFLTRELVRFFPTNDFHPILPFFRTKCAFFFLSFDFVQQMTYIWLAISHACTPHTHGKLSKWLLEIHHSNVKGAHSVVFVLVKHTNESTHKKRERQHIERRCCKYWRVVCHVKYTSNNS